MNKILHLTKVIFKNSGLANAFAVNSTNKKSSPANKIAITLVLIFALITVGFSVGVMSYGLLSLGITETGFDYQYLENILLIYGPIYIALVISIISLMVVSSFFLSQDNHVYMPLPLKSHELFIARLLNVLIFGYIIQVALLLPCLISFNLVLQPSILIYINEIIIFLCLPFIPLALILLVNCLLAKVINLAKYKSLFSFLSFLFTMALVLVIELLSATSLDITESENPAELIAAFKESFNQLAERLQVFKFYMYFPNQSLINPGIMGTLSALLFAIISFSVLFIVIAGFAPSYSSILVKSNDNYVNKTKKKETNLDSLDITISKETKTKSLLVTYIKKEWRELTRSHNNIIQLMLPPFIVPIILAISIFATIFGQDSSADAFNNIVAHMQTLLTIDSGYLVFYVTAGSFFLNAMTFISGTSISREGTNASILKYTPVKPLTVILAKCFWGIILNVFIILAIFLGLGFGMNVNWVIILICIITSILTTIFSNLVMILIDVSRPYLNWINELDPIKQNINVLFEMLACFGLAVFFAGVGAVVMLFLNLNIFIAGLIIIAIGVSCNLAIIFWIKKKGISLFNKIQ